MQTLLISVVVVVVIILSFAIAEAVPQRFTDFNFNKQATEYGLVVGAQATLAKSEKSRQVLPLSEIIAKNLTAFVEARAFYNASLFTLGWDFLSVDTTNQQHQQNTKVEESCFNAGFIEGVLTWDKVLELRSTMRRLALNSSLSSSQQQKHQEFFKTRATHTSGATKYVEEQIAWTKQQVAAQRATSSFWRQVGCHFAQLEGMVAGINQQSWLVKLNFFDVYAINFDAEWSAVEHHNVHKQRKQQNEEHNNLKIFKNDKKNKNENDVESSSSSFPAAPPNAGHCSGFVKLLDDDVLFTQVTWSPYEIMFRVFKTYVMLNADGVVTTVTFSSYPGFIHSADSWYQIASDRAQLAIAETTNGVHNKSLYATMKPQSLSEFFRMQVSNFLATDGKEWVDFYSRHVDGGYNNQNYGLDAKKLFSSSSSSSFLTKSLPEWTFFIAEQIPCRVYARDVTSLFQIQKGWYSYNLPFQRDVYDISGFAALRDEFGAWFSYHDCPRANMFRQRGPSVASELDALMLMRYNEFQHDRYSVLNHCEACANKTCDPSRSGVNAIAARGDLTPLPSSGGRGCFGGLRAPLERQQFGALDAKLCSWKNRSSLAVTAISGPTNVAQPTYVVPESLDWLPIPKRWDFPFVRIQQAKYD